MAGIFGNTGINPYSIYGSGNYGTYYSGQTMPQTPVQIPTMQPQPTPQSFTPQSNIIWVNGEEEISNYPSGRGWQQLFGDKNKNMFYIRETDLNGVTQPIRRLSYKFEDQQPQQTQTQETQQTVQSGVTRDEFDKLAQSVNLMAEKLSDLLK